MKGSMLPLGDAKGAALVLAVEVMAAALTGSAPDQTLERLIDEAAAMIAWMVSPDNSFTTGAVFDLSGGRATY